MSTCPFCNESVSITGTKCPRCGASLFVDDLAPVADTASSATEGDVVSMLQQGRKRDAVRIYREQTGAGWREATDAVQALERTDNLPAASKHVASAAAAVDADLKADLWALLQSGQTFEAVKLYRERTGSTLRTAKDTVEAVAREHGVVVQGSGCLSVLVLCLAVPGLIIALIA
jgi:ribosomal protein L7/L12